MEIIFDEKSGNIFDFFRGIWSILNLDHVKKMKEEYGIIEKNEFEEGLLELVQEINHNDILKKYLLKEVRPEFFLNISKLWNFNMIDDYLEYIKNLNEIQLMNDADRTIQLISKKNYEVEDENLDIHIIKEKIMDILAINELQVELKWEFIMLLRNPKEYMQKLANEFKRYIPLYNSLTDKRQSVLSDYNKEMKTNLSISGLDYLIKEIGGTYKFIEGYNIRVTTSALISLRIYLEEETYYVIIGPSIKNALISNKDNEIEKNLAFVKGLSEPTRYKIIQLLKRRDYYGQEIADTLGITKTNVFYHLDFLISLKLINIIKDGQKNYYSLYKDELNKNLEAFLKLW